MKLASPPADLNSRELPLVSIRGHFWWIWHDDYTSPFFWSQKGLYRFDSKSARYGVLYTGCSLEAAVVEVFADRWLGVRCLSFALVSHYRVTCLSIPSFHPSLLTADVKVVDTTGPRLNQLGVDSMLFASTDYRRTRLWARAFMTHPSGPLGVLYHSRKNPKLENCAFFEPAKASLLEVGIVQDGREESSLHLLECPGLDEILDRYDIALV